MNRKNPGASSTPNAPFDLTPLLDLIFLVLFIVIMGFARITDRNSEELEQTQAELAAAKQVQLENVTESEAYQYVMNEYASSEFGNKLKVVTIYCTYAEAVINPVRSMKITAPDMEETYTFDDTTDDNAMNRLQGKLTTYINENPDYVIVLSVNTKKILRTDFNKIQRIINVLSENYEHVY